MVSCSFRRFDTRNRLSGHRRGDQRSGTRGISGRVKFKRETLEYTSGSIQAFSMAERKRFWVACGSSIRLSRSQPCHVLPVHRRSGSSLGRVRAGRCGTSIHWKPFIITLCRKSTSDALPRPAWLRLNGSVRLHEHTVSATRNRLCRQPDGCAGSPQSRPRGQLYGRAFGHFCLLWPHPSGLPNSFFSAGLRQVARHLTHIDSHGPREGDASLDAARAGYRVVMADADRVPNDILEADFAASKLPGANRAWNTMVEDVVREHITTYALRPELKNLKSPTLFAYGDKDMEGPPSLAHEMAELVPNARCEIVADAGHLVWLDQPRVCVKLLLDFLKSA